MSYLRKLLVAKLKIDKSFVIDMNANDHDYAIVKSTIALAHNLGLKVVAEGVENGATWDKLKELKCDFAQGFFMSTALPPEKLIEWVKGANFKHEANR